MLIWLRAAGLVASPSPPLEELPDPASGNADPPGRYVVHLAGALAALLGRAEGAEGSEDELLRWLRKAGLIAYPSPLLGRLLEKLPEVLREEVLTRLDPTARAMVGGIRDQALDRR